LLIEREIMQKKILGAGLAALLAVTLVTTANLSYAEENSNRGQDNLQNNQEWNASTDAKTFWSKSTRQVRNDGDQARLDAESPSIPGIQVVPAKVFEARVNNGATLTTSAGTGNLVNHGGATIPNVKIYSIFWGSATKLTTSYITTTNNFLSGLSCTSTSCTGLSGLVAQYFGATKPTITWGGTITDTTAAPSSNPSTSSIAAEVAKKYSATLDPNGLYFVFTDSYPTGANYCAWHSAGSVTVNRVAKKFAFAYMPNVLNVAGCAASYLPGYVSSNTPGINLDSLFNVTTHEMYEAMTDAMTTGYAWYDAAGYEIGDKCAWNWATTIKSGAYNFRVQQEYSNLTKTCTSN
jgi:hypothetical protein